ncbi:hypothetical protein FRC02_008610 [Tulasnella sp. 418]|nr:hypothetical protein FRC02_008610 [Tulasnella sp. 418]
MHRLGGVGLAGLDRHSQSLQSFAALSSNLAQTQLQSLQSQLSQFRTALQSFAIEHRDAIRKDPAFRVAFQRMCASIGVDPLAGPRKGGVTGAGSWWSEILGFADWQYELAVQIVDICVSTRDRNGGIIEMGELVRLLSVMRGIRDPALGEITESDITRSIETLRPLGVGYEVITIANPSSSSPTKMVRSVVKELDTDQTVVLGVAQTLGGFVDESALMESHGWRPERARTALQNMLLRDGLCWIDEQEPDGNVSYWVPSVMRWQD